MSGEITQKEMLKAVWDKIDKTSNDISQINATLTAQAAVLKDHIRRSEANERRADIVEEKLSTEISSLKIEMAKLSGMIKLMGGLVAFGSMIAGFLQIFMGK